MRIGFFTDTYLPVANGVCYVIETLRKDLEAAGHEVWVFAPKDLRWHLGDESRVIRYPALGGLFYEDQFSSFFLPPKELKKVKQLKLDLIMAFTPSFIGAFGAYCAEKLDLPYVIQYGSDLEDYADLYKPATLAGVLGAPILAPYFLKMSIRRTLKYWRGFLVRPSGSSYFRYVGRHMLLPLHEQADLIVATSEKTAGRLRSWPIKQNIVAIPTGVDALPDNPDFQKHFRNKYHLKKDDELVLYVGRMSAEKNLERLISSFELLAARRPKLKLLMVGDFQHRWKLERRARAGNFSERIIFTGRIDRQDLGAVYDLADVFVFPSLTDCQALVLNEAAHAGLPTVWCDDDSLNPVLKDGISGLRAKDDDADLAAKIEKILDNPKLAKRLAAGAKGLADDYTEDKQTEKLIDCLIKLTSY